MQGLKTPARCDLLCFVALSRCFQTQSTSTPCYIVIVLSIVKATCGNVGVNSKHCEVPPPSLPNIFCKVRVSPSGHGGSVKAASAVHTVLNEHGEVVAQWCGSNSAYELLPGLVDLRLRFERQQMQRQQQLRQLQQCNDAFTSLPVVEVMFVNQCIIQQVCSNQLNQCMFEIRLGLCIWMNTHIMC